MKISIDNQIVRLFSEDAEKILSGPLGKPDHYLNFNWPSLLEFLEVRPQFIAFDKTHPLFLASISALCEVKNPEDLFYIYDSLFTEMLRQVKALQEIDPAFLLQKIEEQKRKPSFEQLKEILSPALAEQERALQKNTADTMHDLILYLAWDRMCICMLRLFDSSCAHPEFLQNLKKLKWCLIESYHHIASQGRTFPSFYRLIEALFYYQMRKEHLHLHSEADWNLLTRSFQLLKDPNELVDFFYIDHGIISDSKKEKEPLCHLTLDPPELVQSRIILAEYMIGPIKEIFPKWNFNLQPSPCLLYTSPSPRDS